MARIFLSYARKDGSELADELADRLRAADHEVFLDVESIRAGAHWRKELDRRLHWADLIVLLVTEGSNNSDYVFQEVTEADKAGKIIIPVRVKDTPLPVHLRGTWQAVDLKDDNLDNVLLEIERSIRELTGPKITSQVGYTALAGLLTIAIALFVIFVVAIPALDDDDPTPTPGPAAATAIPVFAENENWTPAIQKFGSVDMAMAPAGCFYMGSGQGDTDEKPAHQVCFEEPFWIDLYEVTNAQYGSSGRFPGDSNPRDSVTWFEAKAFCESRGARLPTEAEWEYAARGPEWWIYPWGNEFVPDFLVYGANSKNQTAPVGSKDGGKSWVGAYDLSGNVWEWAADWYGPYEAGIQASPTGSDSGEYRVVRGSSWVDYANNMRLSNRLRKVPGAATTYIGFRCARSE